MTLVQPRPFLEHIFSFLLCRIVRAKGIDIGAYIGKQVLTVAGFRDGALEAPNFQAMFAKEFTVPGEIVLFEGGCAQSRFRVQKAGQLGDQPFALF